MDLLTLYLFGTIIALDFFSAQQTQGDVPRSLKAEEIKMVDPGEITKQDLKDWDFFLRD